MWCDYFGATRSATKLVGTDCQCAAFALLFASVFMPLANPQPAQASSTTCRDSPSAGRPLVFIFQPISAERYKNKRYVNTMARFAVLAVACLSSALGLIAPRPHTAACKQRLATPPRGTVVASLGASDLLVALGEESGLPDPTGAVVAFAFLFAAFAYTQFDMVGVTDQEELEGAEGARRARDALARKRGYFRK